MNHQYHYEKLIKYAKSLPRSKSREQYYELHHIVPKCKGGSDHQSNTVLLTGREHFIAHALLYHMEPQGPAKYQLACSWNAMCNLRSRHHQRYFNSHKYEAARQALALEMSKKTGSKNPFYGRKHSKETKRKISESRKGKCVGKDNPMYGRTRSEYVKQCVSRANTGKRRGKDNPSNCPEVKAKISKANSGSRNGMAKMWRVISPDGTVYEFKGGLKKFLVAHGTTYERARHPNSEWIIESV